MCRFANSCNMVLFCIDWTRTISIVLSHCWHTVHNIGSTIETTVKSICNFMGVRNQLIDTNQIFHCLGTIWMITVFLSLIQIYIYFTSSFFAKRRKCTDDNLFQANWQRITAICHARVNEHTGLCSFAPPPPPPICESAMLFYGTLVGVHLWEQSLWEHICDGTLIWGRKFWGHMHLCARKFTSGWGCQKGFRSGLDI